jgi:hypothetical protein
MKFERNQVLLAKVESTQGVDAEPTAANNAIKSAVISITIDGQELTDPTVKGSISAEPRRYTNKTVTLSIPVVLKGSGTAGLPPEISPLLQCCACKETIVDTSGSEEVNYKPVNTAADMKTSTVYVYKDGLLVKVTGCMGNFSLSSQAGEFAQITFNLQGKFLSATDASNPSSPTYQDVDPVEVKAYGLTFGSYDDGIIRDFGFETGNTVVSRRNLNAPDGLEPYFVTAREPLWNANIEAVAESESSFFDYFDDRTTTAVTFTHGSTAGNKVIFSAPKANYDAPTFSAEDSILMYGLGGQLLENAGQDNFTLTFK